MGQASGATLLRVRVAVEGKEMVKLEALEERQRIILIPCFGNHEANFSTTLTRAAASP
jgi:hypothetical protein